MRGLRSAHLSLALSLFSHPPLAWLLFPCPLLLGCFSLTPPCLVSCSFFLRKRFPSFSSRLFVYLLSDSKFFLRVFHHGCRRSAYPCFVFSASQRTSVNPKNYDGNGDFCIFPPDEPKTTMKTAIFAFSRSTLHSCSPRSQPYTLRRATLHNVGTHVGFFAPTLHT